MSEDAFAPVTAAPVIVGYDGTPESSDALALGLDLAAVFEAPLVVVFVLTSAPLEVDTRTYDADLAEQGERLDVSARRQAGDGEIETVAVLAPSPARELDRIAGERAARVVVVGSTHRGPLRRVVPGTVADRLLAAGARPVAIAPRGFAGAHFELNTVAVGFDGSEESRLALTQAISLARATDASVDLIAAADPYAPVDVAAAALGSPGLNAAPRVTRQVIDRAWSMASAAVRELVPADVRATFHVVGEDPAVALSELSEDLDLLVLGSRGQGPVGRALLGSVSARVLRHSHCPVIVTPRPEDASAETPNQPERASNGDGST